MSVFNRNDSGMARLSPTLAQGQHGTQPAPQAKATDSNELQALVKIAVSRQNDVLLITAVEGRHDRIVYVNDAIAQHAGYSPDEVIGNTPRMFQGPDTSRAMLDRMRAAVDAQRPIRAELLNYRKDGTTYWNEIDITPIFDNTGRATHMVSVQRDITERKMLNEAIKRKNHRFLLALEASANAIWEWNVETDQVEFRDDMPGRSWRGRLHGVIRGQGLSHLYALVHPDDRDRLQQSVKTKLNGTEPLYIEEYRLRRPDGTFADVSDRQFILRDPSGKAERLIGSILDISDKRELEDRRRQSQRLELLGEMTGGIAHNFNNLLTVILGNIDRLRDGQIADRAALQTIQMIDDAAQKGAALTEHMMLFAQTKQLSLKTVDVRRLIDEIAPILRNLLPPEIRFDISHAPDLWPVRTDKVHLEAAILNLVLNARDAMPKGGHLLIQTENIEAGSALVRAQAGAAPSRHVRVKVSDTGIGMPPEDVKLAFEPFFTTKAPGKGTGLGLSSAYGFMQQSGGFLRLESAVGQGTTVCLFLCPATDQPQPDAETTTRRRSTDGGHRILVVDDDPLVRDFVEAMLTSLNYKVTTASDGPQALALLASGGRFDLLFTDIVMKGGMHGWELSRRARAMCPALPVLFTSAYPDLSALSGEERPAQCRILQKPYRGQDLRLAVRSAIAAQDRPDIAP